MRVNQREQWEHALVRARRRGIQVTSKGKRRSDGAEVYSVSSGSVAGRWHLVVVAGKRLVCDCEASRYGRMCSHRAVVRARLLAERDTSGVGRQLETMSEK